MRLWSFHVTRSAANKPLVPGHHPVLDFQQRRMLVHVDRDAARRTCCAVAGGVHMPYLPVAYGTDWCLGMRMQWRSTMTRAC